MDFCKIQPNVLYCIHFWKKKNGWDGVGGLGQVQEGGDIRIPMTDSHCCTGEDNTVFLTNYPPIKNKLKKEKFKNNVNIKCGKRKN